jgi:hypothetical protein
MTSRTLNDRLSITLGIAAIAEIIIGFALIFLCAPAQPQTPCQGKSARDQCACLNMDYDPHLKPVQGEGSDEETRLL